MQNNNDIQVHRVLDSTTYAPSVDDSRNSSIFGYCYGHTEIMIDAKTYRLAGGQYFSFFVPNRVTVASDYITFLVTKPNYRAQNVAGWIEDQGRIEHAAGWSSTKLITAAEDSMHDRFNICMRYYPQNVQDSLNELNHDTVVGCVVSGSGKLLMNEYEQDLEFGSFFYIKNPQLYRFNTLESGDLTVFLFKK